MTNPTTLEKQLIQMDLSKGVNERDRPETMPVGSGFTQVNNLLQDQTGAWVKRPGDSPLGGVSGTDDQGTLMSAPSRVLRLKDGLALVATLGRFYQLQESSNVFRDKGRLPEFAVVGNDLVSSSGPFATPFLYGCASSTKYHAVVAVGGPSTVALGVGAAGVASVVLTIYDRNSGASVAVYDVSSFAGNNGQYKLAFLNDQYLLIAGYLSPIIVPGAGLRTAVIDTGTTLPLTSAAVFASSTLQYAGVGISAMDDIAVYPGTSFYVAVRDTIAGVVNGKVFAINASNALTDSATVFSPIPFAGPFLIYVNSTNVWWSGGTSAGAVNVSSLASVTVASALTGAGAAVYGMTVDANGFLFLMVSSAVTVGTTLTRQTFWKATVAGGVTCAVVGKIDGWRQFSNLFPDGAGNVFCHLVKDTNSGQLLGANVVANVSDMAVASNNFQTYNSVHPACTLDPFIGYASPFGITGLSLYLTGIRYFAVDYITNTKFCPVVIQNTAARGFAYVVFPIDSYLAHEPVQAAVFCNQNYMSCGTHVAYAGGTLSEADFVDMPLLAGVQGAAGALAAGIYKFVAVFRYVDETGTVAFSRMTDPVSVTIAASKKIDLTSTACAITMRDPVGNRPAGASQVSVDVYRTLVGGTQYYLCASSQSNFPSLTQSMTLQASGFFTVSDNLTDAQLATQQLLYRQPGTPNAPLDRYPPPGSSILCQHRDRLFTTDPSGVRVCYSSFAVDGEAAWFNPNFSFLVHGGSGPITGLVSMDGRLYVFKRDGIWVVDGDGPAEGGVVGNEYSPPQRLATEYGCIAQKSIVVTTNGIVFRSARGIELLNRSLQVQWVGDRVQNTVNTYPKTMGAVLDTFGRVHVLVAAQNPDNTTLETYAGRELVWDIPADAWSIHDHAQFGYTTAGALQGICMANIFGKGETIVYANAFAGANYQDPTKSFDGVVGGISATTYVPFTLETGWIRNGQQTRQRFSEALFLGKKLSDSNHALTISLAYDYNDAYVDVRTWQPSAINPLTIEELEYPPSKPESLAFRVKIVDAAPADTGTYPVGNGRGCDVLGVAIEIATKTGAPFGNRSGT